MNHRNPYYYGSDEATAETLDSKDSLSDIDNDTEADDDPQEQVHIVGLELLMSLDELSLSSGSGLSGEYEEVDSLILTRRRLPSIWLGGPRGGMPPRKMLLARDSLELTRKRLPQIVNRRGRKLSRVKVTREEIPDLESVSLENVTTESDDSTWGSFELPPSVDSLILTRKRFASLKERKDRIRRHGTDLLFLRPRNKQKAHPIKPAKVNAKSAPGRIHSSRHKPGRAYVHSLSPARTHSGSHRVVRALH